VTTLPLDGVRGVLLDVDDTLVRTAATGYEKVVEASKELGLSPPMPKDFRRVYGRVPFADCVAAWHPGCDVDAFSSAYDALAERFPPRPCGDAADPVRALRRRIRVGVLTNGPEAKTRAKLAAVGLTFEGLDGVWHAGNVEHPKPDPRAFEPALRRWRLRPHDVLYVADSPRDLAAARAAGVRFAAVTTGIDGDRASFEGCDGVVFETFVQPLEAVIAAC
jgi:phosphoglycolate phosphatase-like HAD superfamily hydrolase